ncbi:Mechanosensitive ion channel-domain-containing protein [Gorgonomyces haynaldii]|nr:Mechanosensitive ion channel-domain-containing protein [Gorgonomyces haynaldii]
MRKGILIGEKKRLHGHKSLDLLSEKNGIRLSKKLFNALCPPGKNMITIDQFYNIFETEKEATEAFKTLDRDNNGSLTFKELKRAILHIYRERRNLFRSLGDLSQALGILNSIFYCISLLLTLLTALPFWGINVNAIVPFTSILLTLSFIFGSAVSNMFNCMIFIFVHHPYDTGDRIWINDVNYVVAQLNLLNTVLIRSDGHRVYMPNNEIASKSIHNIRRSGDMAEPISVEIGFYTPEEKLQQLERNMNAFIDSNPRDYLPGMFINVSELDHCNSVKISFWLSYKGNWQDSGYRIKRRSAFVRHLRLQLMQLEIRFYFPPQPFINDDFKTEGARALMGQNPAA